MPVFLPAYLTLDIEVAILKMALELDAIGEKWPASVPEEVLHAIRDQKNS